MQTSVDDLIATMGDDVARVGAGAFHAAAVVPAHDADPWNHLIEEWGSLPVDKYLPDGATYRRRRYARIEANPTDDDWTLRTLAHGAFCQAEETMPLYAGRARLFPPVPESVTSSGALQHLLRFDLDLVSRVVGDRLPYRLGLHMIRVTVTPAMGVSPAPEGRHQDGHRFVVMHLIARKRCLGGVSRVHGEAGMVLETTLEGFLDSIVVDDCRVEHEVGPITTKDAHCWRDTLLVDFDGLEEER